MAGNNSERAVAESSTWVDAAVVELALLLSRDHAVRLEALGSSQGLTLAQLIRGIVADYLAEQDWDMANAPR